jgi:metal-sulfur cluster biosynthetic enzyme
MISKEQVIEAIKKVIDPELNIDVWTLGLIYDIDVKDDGVDITMTLTSALCPFADELVMNVEKEVAKAAGKDESDEDGFVRVNITFDPPWKPSEELRTMLGV